MVDSGGGPSRRDSVSGSEPAGGFGSAAGLRTGSHQQPGPASACKGWERGCAVQRPSTVARIASPVGAWPAAGRHNGFRSCCAVRRRVLWDHPPQRPRAQGCLIVDRSSHPPSGSTHFSPLGPGWLQAPLLLRPHLRQPCRRRCATVSGPIVFVAKKVRSMDATSKKCPILAAVNQRHAPSCRSGGVRYRVVLTDACALLNAARELSVRC